MVNFVSAVAYHSCLSLPAAFTQPGRSLLAEPCMVSVDLNLESLPSHCLYVSSWSGKILSHSSRETSLIRLAAVALGVELGTLPFSSLSSLPPCTPCALVSVSSLADDGMRVGLFAFSPLRGEMRRSGEGEGERRERGHRSSLSPLPPFAAAGAAPCEGGRQGHFFAGGLSLPPFGPPSLRRTRSIFPVPRSLHCTEMDCRRCHLVTGK